MGLAIKEAMAASKPAIGTNSGGIPEAIVHNDTGLIVPHCENGEIDVYNYAMAMLALANDSDLRKSMGQKARLRAEQIFSQKDTVAKSASVFVRCIP